MELQVRDLCVARGGRLVLTGVLFTLNPGSALLLRGPNGIGKTTLLRTLAGLQPEVSGTMSVPPESIAYASHADGVKSMLSVAENLSFWARVYGTKETDTAIGAFNLRALADRRAASLSAGQRRRLGLARLLVTGRPIWLLDEPTVSLDAASSVLFADVLRAHLASGGSALIATHVDLGLEGAEVLDLAPFAAGPNAANASSGFAEAFL